MKTFKSFIFENFNDTPNSLVKDNSLPNGLKNVGKMGRYTVMYRKHPKIGTNDYYCTLNNKWAVEMSLYPEEIEIEGDFFKCQQVETVSKSLEFGNDKTVVYDLYNWLVNNKIEILMMGTSQTIGSRKLWQKLLDSKTSKVVMVAESDGGLLIPEKYGTDIRSQEYKEISINSTEEPATLILTSKQFFDKKLKKFI